MWHLESYETLEEALVEIKLRRNQLREMREVFQEYIEHNGAVHYGECPEDDTCHCKGKEINDRISKIFRATALVIGRDKK